MISVGFHASADFNFFSHLDTAFVIRGEVAHPSINKGNASSYSSPFINSFTTSGTGYPNFLRKKRCEIPLFLPYSALLLASLHCSRFLQEITLLGPTCRCSSRGLWVRCMSGTLRTSRAVLTMKRKLKTLQTNNDQKSEKFGGDPTQHDRLRWMAGHQLSKLNESKRTLQKMQREKNPLCRGGRRFTRRHRVGS
ncbi:hypothetical protein F5148DRAFT_247293 [Russula earlei]|uniref:Uncharacterized protein n=1 Tax=Russula earlei TaxID=71964 RepID=A0ACC0U3F4_9AGAM|nr:hypothetical protein F5148DRAFT_247293 [Russula earlei]